MLHVDIWTDGGCRPNPGPGGWAAILKAGDHTKEISGREDSSTNQRMELTALLMALRALKQSCEVTLYADSEYVGKGVTEWLPNWKARGWRRADKKPVENVDLWQLIDKVASQHQISFTHIRGHTGDLMNERCDTLVMLARAQ